MTLMFEPQQQAQPNPEPQEQGCQTACGAPADMLEPGAIRHDWRPDEVRALYDAPLLELVFRAAEVHRRFHDPGEVQVCKLINIKTGACPEDCKYCSQSSRYQTEVTPEPLMDKREVL